MYLHPVFKRHILKSQKLQGWKKINHATNEKPYVAILMSEITDFKSRSISRDRDSLICFKCVRHNIQLKGKMDKSTIRSITFNIPLKDKTSKNINLKNTVNK